MKLLSLLLAGTLLCASALHAADKGAEKAPAIPIPPLSIQIRPADGDYGPTKWAWDSVASAKDPVTGETLYIGGRIGGAEYGSIGHWALGADGKTWRELKGSSAVLDPLRAKTLAARISARLAEAKAREIFFDAREPAQEQDAIKKDPTKLIGDALKTTSELQAALSSAKATGWEAEGITRALAKVDKALASFKAAQAGFSKGEVNAELLKHCFDGQWGLDEAADCLASVPGPREGAIVEADTANKCVVVFGGSHCDYALSDTWIYDCTAKTWRQVWPKTVPSARFRSKMTYSADTKVFTLSGGQTILNKMVYQQGEMAAPAGDWVFNAKEGSWQGENGVEAGTRIYRTIVPGYNPTWYDAASRGSRKEVDAWAAGLPANTWVKVGVQPAPAPERDWGTAAYDPERDQIYRWTGGHCADPANGMSTYHLGINRWSMPFVPEIFLGRKGMSFNARPDCANHTYLRYGFDPASKTVVCVSMGGTGIYNPEIGDFEGNIPHPFNCYFYETCTAGTPKGFVVWARGYFGVLDVKTKQWSPLPVKGKLPSPKTDGSAFCYDAKNDVLWITTFLDYQKPSGNIWRYDMKTGEVQAMNPANMETIGKAKGFKSEIRESLYVPEANLVMYNNLVQGKHVAYDISKNRWVLLENVTGIQERMGTVSDTLSFDTKRGIIWDLNSYKSIYALKLDPKTLVMTEKLAQ